MFNRPGLWYDAPRRRWRVRIYRKGLMRHLSYHNAYEDALRAHQRALSCPVSDKTKPANPNATDTKSLIHRLRQAQ